MKRVAIFIALFASTLLLAQNPDQRALLDSMDAKVFESKAGTTLPYRLLVPEGDKLPLFLCMHGAGGRGDDNKKTIVHSPWAVHAVASKEAQAKHPCIVLVPQCANGKRWVDVDWNTCIYSTEEIKITPEQTAAVELLDQVIKETGADPKRIYVGGFSMGGYGTWDVVARFPETFAAAVPVCGGAAPNRAKAMKDVAVWAFHGDADGVVPPKGSRAMIDALKAAGAEPKYTEFKGVGHNAWTPAWRNPELIEWVFKQKKK